MHREVRGRGRRPRAALSAARRLGVLGGTFNPPHVAHLVCAVEAAEQLELERVLLVPTARPPHKELADDPGASERLELCRLAATGEPRLEVSKVEVDRGGPSFTADTLRELHARDPEAELTFIVGGDMALSLPTWREPEEVLRLARLGVAERDGAGHANLLQRLAGLGDPDRIDFFHMPRLDISSSLIRSRVRSGRSVRWLVPAAVEERIAARALYRDEAPS